MARKRAVKEPTPRVNARKSNSKNSSVNLSKVEKNKSSNLKSSEKKTSARKSASKPENSVVVSKPALRTRSKVNSEKIVEEKKSELKKNDEIVAVKKKNALKVLTEIKPVKKVQLKSVNSNSEDEKIELPIKRQSKRINEQKAFKPNEELPKLAKKQTKTIISHLQEDNTKEKEVEEPVQRQSKRINDRKAPESPKPVKKQVRIAPESTESSKVKVNLRKRKTRNYQDKSLEVSQAEEEDKVPIYQRETVKQPLNKKKPKNDLYEFDSDGEGKAKKRKQDDDDDEFQPPVEKKSKKRTNNTLKKTTIKKKSATFQKNNNNSMQLFNKLVTGSVEKPRKVEKNSVIVNKTNKSQEVIMNNKDESIQIMDEVILTAKTPQKINIINNTVISRGAEEEKVTDLFRIDSPSAFQFTKPDANSTMLNNVLTPWRFNDINIRRNPHFISIKGSALPNISQEMVIDHTVVEKFDECSKTPRYATEFNKNSPIKPKSVQKTLTQYFDNSVQNKENVHQSVHHQSLFGNDELSPIKINASSAVVSPVKAKRRILADKTNENDAEIIVQADEEKSDGNSQRDVTLFGFGDSSDEEEEEAQIGNNNKAKEAKPFRLSINKASDRKYLRKKKNEVKVVEVEVPAEQEEEEEDDGSSGEEECLNSDEEVPSGEVKLFDDLTPPTIKVRENDVIDYNIKVPVKRKRTKAKKTKDKLTKAEKEAADQWVEAFNSMCQEVDEYELEIE